MLEVEPGGLWWEQALCFFLQGLPSRRDAPLGPHATGTRPMMPGPSGLGPGPGNPRVFIDLGMVGIDNGNL